MQNSAFRCIFGSQNRQLLTGADTESRTGRELGGEGVTPKASTSEKNAERRRKRRGGMGKEFSSPTDYGVCGNVVTRKLLRGGVLSENGF